MDSVYILRDPGTGRKQRHKPTPKKEAKPEKPEKDGQPNKLESDIAFFEKTSIKNKIKVQRERVQSELMKADDDLEEKRSKLRSFLLEEESDLVRETIHKGQTALDNKWELLVKRVKEIQHSKELAHRALVEEKLEQYFRENNQEFREHYSAQLSLDAAEAQKFQMEHNKLKKNQEKLIDRALWGEIEAKEVAAQLAVEEKTKLEKQEAIKRNEEILRLQLLGRQITAEEYKFVQKQEAEMAGKSEEAIKLKELKELERKQSEKLERYKVMIGQLNDRRNQIKERATREKELDNAYLQILKDNILKEQRNQVEGKSRARQEMLQYMEYNKKFKEFKNQEEDLHGKLCDEEMKAVEQKRQKLRQRRDEIMNKLNEEVYEGRKQQILDRQKSLLDEKKLKEEESKMTEICSRAEDAILAAIKEEARAESAEMNAQLLAQIEYNNMMKDREKAEDWQFIRDQERLRQLEMQKLNEFKSKPVSQHLHPFYKILKK